MMYCYYPTTTVAIDDEIDFLGVITQHLGIADCISYSSPSKAIESVKNNNPLARIASRISKKPNPTDLGDDIALHINMHNLHLEIYSDKRFNDISVLIIDYCMDEMSGIEVCEALREHPAKKILLTGGRDKEKVAIEAFNKGIIHRFINKSDPNFPSQLKQAIAMLKEAYFRDLTTSIFSPSNSHIFNNPAYVNFTRNLQDQFDITEHYLLDMIGSKLFLNKNGIPLWLVIKQDADMENFVSIANDQDAEDALIASLVNKERIPFFFSEEDFLEPVSNWNNFLYSAHPFPGLNGVYYSVIEGNIGKNLNSTNIISYNKYKEFQKNGHAVQV